MEIERKYLVIKELWERTRDSAQAYTIRQSYLNTDPGCTVRIRISNREAYLTIKGKSLGIAREEFEYPVPLQDGIDLMRLSATPVVEKIRYVLDYKGYVWDIDEFLGDNEGLILAEVELDSADENPELPEWIGREVSGDPDYYNLQLALNPIKHRK